MGDVLTFFRDLFSTVADLGHAIFQEIENPETPRQYREWKSIPQDIFVKQSRDLKKWKASLSSDALDLPKIQYGDEKTSDYLAGLVTRAKLLYGKEDPSFVQEYHEYLELTVQDLKAEAKPEELATLQERLRSPEDYRARGFLNLPKRPEHALAGSQFLEQVLGVNLEEFKKNPRQLGKLSKIDRENAILEQIELGNIPDFCDARRRSSSKVRTAVK